MDFDQKIARYEGLAGLLGTFAERGSPQAVLPLVEEIAAFAESRHAGTFADGRVENPAYEIGRSLDARRAAGRMARQGDRRRILHVGSDLPDIGGHTRIATNWIRNDRRSVHGIAMIGTSLSSAMSAAAIASGGSVSFLSGSRREKARQLRSLARTVDLVVLHVSNRDVVPVLAFADDDLPPVAVLNHSDHLFWLGSSIADSVVNLRSIGAALSRDRRLTRHNALMAIPLSDPLERMSRSAARRLLGIPESQLMLLSVGRSIKYKPDATHDFFRAARAVLDRHRDAHLHIVGPTADEGRVYSPFGAHERVHFAGPQPDATAFQVAADLYIESFPFGSQTACLEACMCGLPPVLAHTPAAQLLATNEDCISELVTNPGSEAEHVEIVSTLVGSAAARRELGAEVRRRILAHHTEGGWVEGLEAVYSQILGLSHRHAPIAAEPCRREPYDVALAAWLDAQASAPLAAAAKPQQALRQRVDELAYDFRERGGYSDAFWMLESYRRREGLSVDLAMSAGKLGPHWLLNVAKRAVGAHRNT
jgi:glycosyltransferase involved in cell wall biosynthesis